MKIDIKNLSRDELTRNLEEMHVETYRAGQIIRWLFKAGVAYFDQMSDIPAPLRQRLKERFHITRLTMLDSRSSMMDGTTKYLFKLEDDNTIETVFLPEARRATICLSSQVGCKFACAFCASAPFGFVRNLKASEIVDEVLAVRHKRPAAVITNLVFMGIGEPFDNYDNVMRAIRIFNDKDAFAIGARRITISTCGMLPAIDRLAREDLQVELSVSLHSADDRIRSRLVPINKRYPVLELMRACREYIKNTNRVITFEYILLKGVNSSPEDARKLVKVLTGMKCKVNAISYNNIKAGGFDQPSAQDVRAFMKALKDGRITATLRKSKGEDIDAGCGQLRIARM